MTPPTLAYNPWLDQAQYWLQRLRETAVINGRRTRLIDYIGSFSRRKHFYPPFTRARRRFLHYLIIDAPKQYQIFHDFYTDYCRVYEIRSPLTEATCALYDRFSHIIRFIYITLPSDSTARFHALSYDITKSNICVLMSFLIQNAPFLPYYRFAYHSDRERYNSHTLDIIRNSDAPPHVSFSLDF